MGLLQWAGVAQSTVPVPDVHSCLQSEQEVRITQSEFDRQAEITRLLLEGISSTHVSTQKVLRRKGNIRCLLKKAAVNYLGTLVLRFYFSALKHQTTRVGFLFLNSNLIFTEFNFTFPLTFRMQKFSFSFFIPSFPFIRSIEC